MSVSLSVHPPSAGAWDSSCCYTPALTAPLPRVCGCKQTAPCKHISSCVLKELFSYTTSNTAIFQLELLERGKSEVLLFGVVFYTKTQRAKCGWEEQSWIPCVSPLPLQQKGKQAGVAPFSSQHLEPGASAAKPALISCWQTAACSGCAWSAAPRAGDSCTVHTCCLRLSRQPQNHFVPLQSHRCCLKGSQSHTGLVLHSSWTLRTPEEGFEPAESLWAKDLSLSLSAEGSWGCSPLVKPWEVGLAGLAPVELPHIWLCLPHAKDPAKAEQGQTGALEDCSRKPPGYEG